MERYNFLSIILFFTLFLISNQCDNNEVSIGISTCMLIEKLINDPTEILDISNINYLSQTIKAISNSNYDIDFIKLDSEYLQNKESKIYISNECINSIEVNLTVDKSTGMVMIISNSNNKNANGIPERNFSIRFGGSGENRYINSKNFDFYICYENPIILNMSINIDEIQIFKKQEKNNAKDDDIFILTDIDVDQMIYTKN